MLQKNRHACRPVNILTVVSLQTKHLQVRVAMYCLRDLFYISLSSLYVSLSSRMDKAFGDRIDGTGMLSLVYNAKAFCKTTGRFKWKIKSGVTVAMYFLFATFWLF